MSHPDDGVVLDDLPDSRGSDFRSRRTGSWLNQEDIKEVVRFDQFTTIDWVQDELQEHKSRLAKQRNITNNRSSSLRDKVVSISLNWFVLASMGVIIGVIAATLNVLTAWLANIRLGHCSGAVHLNKSLCCLDSPGEESCSRWVSWSDIGAVNYMMYILFSFLFALASAELVRRFAPAAAGSGISEIKCIVSGFIMDGFLGWWTLVIKSIGLPLAIGSGLSVGKEGPSVHYAVCVGNCISRIFNRYRKLASKSREFLTAASAAGVAVAFGSPMGGVLFSMEEISSVFQLSTIWKSYVCALVAVTTLSAINPFGTGQLVMFEVTYDNDWHFFEVPAYILLGVFGGIYGIVVSKFNKRVVSFRKKYLALHYGVREVLTLAVLTASFSYFNQFLKIDMTETMEILFHECGRGMDHPMCDPHSKKTLLIVSLLFATVARTCLTIFTYGCKVPAGIFVPSMAAGATFGRAVGMLMQLIYQAYPDSFIFNQCSTNASGGPAKCVIPGTYAFLGAAAGLSGITQLTVTVVVIMFELTGALRYIIPTMIVVSITKGISDKWGDGGGIADQMIKFNGLPLIEPNEDHHFNNATVVEAMSTVTVSLPYNSNDLITKSQLRNIIDKTKYNGFPVIQSLSCPKIVGFVTRLDLESALNERTFSEDENTSLCDFSDANSHFSRILNQSPVIVNCETDLEYLLDIFVKLGPRFVLINDDVGTLCGLVTRKDILRYEHSIHNLSKDKQRETEEEKFNEKVWGIMLYYNNAVRKL